jgi:hypothetical protein
MLHGLYHIDSLVQVHRSKPSSSNTLLVSGDGCFLRVSAVPITGISACRQKSRNTHLGCVDTVEELSDILVLDSALVCDGGGGLRNGLNVVSLENDFILDVR